ncbi:E3 ubiquitin-protein ligase KCMF1 [Drosophila biarmipes]|uniref:E3 ubiquitin-protein ligase KCMF1 n=1 Tax=Drosophila biarmipes TaxID=125945 RepID=UPI0007E778CC|nr:E3 ubiquitin-protein ligase KCMF1 [Drosophila biarmipes]
MLVSDKIEEKNVIVSIRFVEIPNPIALFFDQSLSACDRREVRMGHRNICCDGCERQDFRGRRYRCLHCVNFDLCGDCYDRRFESPDHHTDHPMQLILDPVDSQPGLLLNGEVPEVVHLPNCSTCPYCGEIGLTAKRLIEHVCGHHRQADGFVVCPLCAGLPGVELVAISNLSGHLLLNHIDHANSLEPETPPLRRTFTRSRTRRRRLLQSPPSQQLQPPNNVIFQLASASWNAADPQLPPSILVDPPEEQAAASPIIVEPQLIEQPERYLLLQWVEQQEMRCQQETEMSGSQRRRHALFAEHLVISMLCSEELETSEDRVGNRDQRLGLSKVMSVMSLPWTRAWQATQLGGSEGEGSKIQGAVKLEIPLADGLEQHAKPEKSPAEEAID